MKSLTLPSFAMAALLAVSHVVTEPIPHLDTDAIALPRGLNAMTLEGCFHSNQGLKFNATWTWQTSGWCQPKCVGMNQAVLATTNGSDCWCGNVLPPASSKVADSFCNKNCTGFGQEMCGGDGYYSVWNDGLSAHVDSFGGPASTSTAAPSSTAPSANRPSTVTIGGQTVVVTAPPGSNKSGGSGPNKGAIAGGVVVGILAVAAIAGGLFFFMRNRKRRELEEEHRRNAAINSIMTANKGAGSGSSSFSDTRLDPIMAQRRMSDGSIADNEDYSRRILKVTNA